MEKVHKSDATAIRQPKKYVEEKVSNNSIHEEKSNHDLDPDIENKSNEAAPQHTKTTEKRYECPHCDFIATGSDNMKLYEDAVRHKNSSHKDVGKIGDN